MNDTEFDHDAEANEYHIAVKQHLYEEVATLKDRLAREAVVSETQRDQLDIANARIRELEAALAAMTEEREDAVDSMLDLGCRLEGLRKRLTEREADARLRLTRDDLALGMSAATFGTFVAEKAGGLCNGLVSVVKRYEAALDAAVAGEGDGG